MAKKKTQPTRTKLEEFNDQLSGVEQKFEKNRKTIYIILGAIVAVALGWWGYNQLYAKPQKEKAVKAIGQADLAQAQQNDSLALIEYKKVAKKYGGKIGNRAKIECGQILYRQGKFEEALKYYNDADPAGELVGPLMVCQIGDCYASLKSPKFDKALKAYDKAIDMAGDNPELVPYALKKKASILHHQKKYKDEIAVYERIEKDFMGYYQRNGIERYKTRAEAMSGK